MNVLSAANRSAFRGACSLRRKGSLEPLATGTSRCCFKISYPRFSNCPSSRSRRFAPLSRCRAVSVPSSRKKCTRHGNPHGSGWQNRQRQSACERPRLQWPGQFVPGRSCPQWSVPVYYIHVGRAHAPSEPWSYPRQGSLRMSVDELTPRQADIIRVATSLFARSGYHAVGINEISGELGLSGPAFYRHFSSKSVLLVAILDRIICGQLEHARELVSAVQSPSDALAALIESHVDFVFQQVEYFVTWRTEFRTLAESDRRRLSYLQGLYIQEWRRTLSRLRPELSDGVGHAMCLSAIALLQAPTDFDMPLPRREMAPLLQRMATHLLLGGT